MVINSSEISTFNWGMKNVKMVAEDYLRLFQALDVVEIGKKKEVTMEQISTALFCTPRNAKYILNKMIELKWLQFFSGRGRGHKSTITFLSKPEEVILKESESLISAGDISSIFSLIGVYKGDVNVQDIIENWLNSYFGYKKGVLDVLRFPIFRPINTLDPMNVFYDFDAHMVEQIYNTLLTINAETNTLEGLLAHFWEADEDYTVWRFYLRKGIMFHHGRELEARDIVFTIERFLEAEDECAQVWLMETVQKVTVIDRYVVEVKLTSPNTLFAHYLSFTPTAIVPYDIGVSGYVGTGPFKVIKQTDDVCVLEVYRSYFQGRAHLDKIEIHTLPKDMLSSKFTDDLAQIFVNTGEGAKSNNPSNWDRTEVFYKGSSLFSVNLGKKNRPQCDPLFRKALSLLIDRKKLIEELGEFRLYPSHGFVYEGDSGSSYSDVLREAEALLRQSSYNGEKLSMYVYERHYPDALWLKKELAHFGIDIDVTILSWEDMLHEKNQREADFILFEAVWSQSELSQLELLKYSRSFLRTHLSLAGKAFIDEKIEQLLKLSSEAERSRLFLEIERELKEEYMLIFLVHKALSSSFPSIIKGVKFNTRGGIIFKDIWLHKESLGIQ